jgi:amino acid adenylation domain-containing protein
VSHLLHGYLSAAAARLPDKIALVTQGQRFTYAELERRANALAHTLRARGIVRGDRVIVFLENGVDAAVAFWAALKADAIVSLVNTLTRTEKLEFLLNDCRASAFVSDGNLARIFAPAIAKAPHLKLVLIAGTPEWDEALSASGPAPPSQNLDIDPAAIIYTSGSTGEPKGVVLTHRNIMTAASSIATYLENCEDDVVGSVLPLAFGYGMLQMVVAFRVGARLVLEKSFTFPAKVLATFAEEKITGMPGVPTIYATLTGLESIRNYDLSSLRYFTNAAAALPKKNALALRELYPRARVFCMYGLTECLRCCYLPPEDLERKPESVGIAIPNTEIWIVDEHDRRVGPGVVGQLVIRGGHVMSGYWERPELTEQKLRPGPVVGERVLYTGDLFRLDDEGHLHFVSRMDDIIKSRGEKVAPREVEHALVNVAGVKEAAVIGIPDELLGQAVKAFVVLEGGATLGEKELLRECQKRLESFMVPKLIEFVPDLPKTMSGKIKKTDLR